MEQPWPRPHRCAADYLEADLVRSRDDAKALREWGVAELLDMAIEQLHPTHDAAQLRLVL